jgi:hypothetical protein
LLWGLHILFAAGPSTDAALMILNVWWLHSTPF